MSAGNMSSAWSPHVQVGIKAGHSAIALMQRTALRQQNAILASKTAAINISFQGKTVRLQPCQTDSA